MSEIWSIIQLYTTYRLLFVQYIYIYIYIYSFLRFCFSESYCVLVTNSLVLVTLVKIPFTFVTNLSYRVFFNNIVFYYVT